MIKSLDLFAGVGGLRLGLEKALKKLGLRHECVLYSVINKHCQKTYEKNFSSTKLIENIKNVSKIELDIPDHDILLAGFPCQPFSNAGVAVRKFLKRYNVEEKKLNSNPISNKLNNLADIYHGNFSLFQSLPDMWAIDQLHPIAPIQKLNRKPNKRVILNDITCDSEGRIDSFVDSEDERSILKLHSLKESEPYYLGFFLVGAYQDIMGDLHNLFGRVNEVHVFLEDDEEDGFYIEDSIRGFSVTEVLGFTQYDERSLMRKMKRQIDQATKEDLIKPREGIKILDIYSQLLSAQTYLKD